MTSDNHLTGALHTVHHIPAYTCPGSLSWLKLGYSPDHRYCCFDHFRSLYISWYGLATLLFHIDNQRQLRDRNH